MARLTAFLALLALVVLQTTVNAETAADAAVKKDAAGSHAHSNGTAGTSVSVSKAPVPTPTATKKSAASGISGQAVVVTMAAATTLGFTVL
ncbi:hypothetical protein PINS_up006019 [Pythium insidiosum]|nr:hypothetical protein PINS_up006019 [Pythium insidiosum]